MVNEMTTEIQGDVLPEMRDEWKRLTILSDEQLDQELGQTLELSAKSLVKLALIVRQKEERGHDLSGLRIGMLGYLRKIAYGQLLPEVLARFGSYPLVLRRVSSLPLPDQRRCVSDRGVKVAVCNGESVDFRLTTPVQMSSLEIRQVFASDHIREPEEQVVWAKSQLEHPLEPKRPDPPPYTIAGNRLIVNKPVTLTKRDLQRIIKAMEE